MNTLRPLNLLAASLIGIVAGFNALHAQEQPSAPTGKPASISAIGSAGVSSALDKVRALPTISERTEKAQTFKLATEEMATIAPEYVQTRTETIASPHPRMPHLGQQKTIQTIDHASMVPLLVKALQEQQAEIERLRNEISSIKAQAQK